mgnify:FL=1
MELRLDRQMYIADNIRRGLCRSCNNPRLEGTRHCKVHLEKIRGRVHELRRKRAIVKLADEVPQPMGGGCGVEGGDPAISIPAGVRKGGVSNQRVKESL